MPMLDEEQFESYLKGFRPMAPESLEGEWHPRPRRGRFAWTAWAAAYAACLVLAVLFFSHRRNAAGGGNRNPSSVSQFADSRPLTLGRANALLAEVPSFQEAADQLSFPPQPPPQSQGKQSALAALGKEDFEP